MNYTEYLKPLEGIIIKQEEKPDKIGSMVLPKSADIDMSNVATILAVAETPADHKYHGLNPGDKIIFREFAGSRIRIKNEELLVIEFADILALLLKDIE